ncbi:MAG: WD40 repeat domain-containing protein [Clostridia bacterium]|nr:WD40 repeat domain-containing protein [Clostridia bacterium]
MHKGAAEKGELLIGLTDQQNRQITVISMDLQAYEYTVAWHWSPSEEQGFCDTDRYTFPSDARLRRHPQHGKEVLLTCASGGFCAIAQYPTGECVWQDTLDPHDNPHAIELLPNGCVVIAASTGNFIRIYPENSNQGYVQYDFIDAHGLLWDPDMQVLWAVGKSTLTAYEFSGSPSAPGLTERRELRVRLPIANGHDVFASYGNPDTLWVISSAPFIYDKVLGKWDMDYPGSHQMLQANTKSCSSAGSISVQTIADGTWQIWDSAALHLYDSDTDKYIEVPLHTAVYRARIWNANYR